jgi:hypothetical protein
MNSRRACHDACPRIKRQRNERGSNTPSLRLRTEDSPKDAVDAAETSRGGWCDAFGLSQGNASRVAATGPSRPRAPASGVSKFYMDEAQKTEHGGVAAAARRANLFIDFTEFFEKNNKF